MTVFTDDLRSIWRRTFRLGWPIAIEQILTTLMRTVDILVTGLFSPAAVAAIGLADLYANIPRRIGVALGTGAIALSSQDTGRGAELTRDQAITQAMIIGTLCGIPLLFIGFLFSNWLIAILGAELEVVRMGAVYLTILFAAAPMRIISVVGVRSLQGTGDTRTPMLIIGAANTLNILLTVSLGLGIWFAPRMGIIGVGIGTAAGRTFEALSVTAVIAFNRTSPTFVRPRNILITRQLFTVSIPNFAEGLSSSLARFPLNAILLVFGTEPNAAYHIGRRVYQQLAGPLYRSFGTVSSIIVGQTLGEGRPEKARYATWAILALSASALGGTGLILFMGAESLASFFTQDPTTLGYAIAFTRTFAVSMLFFGIFYPLAGTLRAAGDTRTPFYARLGGEFGIMLGGSYILGIWLGFGLPGVYFSLVLSFGWWAAVVAVGFLWGEWSETAARMIAEREKSEEVNGQVE